MNGKQVAAAVLGMIARVTIAGIAIMLVYRIAISSYDFGYKVFADEAMSPAPGRNVSVAIVQGKSVMEIGEILEIKGLIEDARLFYIQEFVSEYKGQIQPGIYELNTSMTPREMLAVMSKMTEDAEGTDGAGDGQDIRPTDTDAGQEGTDEEGGGEDVDGADAGQDDTDAGQDDTDTGQDDAEE